MVLHNFDVIQHFKPEEFDSPDEGSSWKNMEFEFVFKLDKARIKAGVPFVVTSGYRTESHNKKVGGSPTSSHLLGLAADIACDSSTNRWKIVFALRDAGFKRIGIGKDFIHVDLDKRDFKPQEILFDYYKN